VTLTIGHRASVQKVIFADAHKIDRNYLVRHRRYLRVAYSGLEPRCNNLTEV
jgi:hypothetical protein